jgi:hypothetical protein
MSWSVEAMQRVILYLFIGRGVTESISHSRPKMNVN